MIFEIYTDKASEYRFRLKAKNGQTLLYSDGIEDLDQCKNIIRAVIKNIKIDEHVNIIEKDYGYMVYIRASNGMYIAYGNILTRLEHAVNTIDDIVKNNKYKIINMDTDQTIMKINNGVEYEIIEL